MNQYRTYTFVRLVVLWLNIPAEVLRKGKQRTNGNSYC